MKSLLGTLILAGLRLAAAAPYPGCDAPVDAEFRMTTLVTRQAGDLNEPLKMDFDMTPQGNVDIYFIEKAGKIRKYDAASRTVLTLGSLNAYVAGPYDEYGLMGLALDPGFKINRNLYVLYMPASQPIELRISRFTLNGSGVDMASEKILIKFPATIGWHGGGGMAFDAAGNLWVGVGDTRAGEVAAPNTNDLRGKILRIHPMADGSYTIPDGNLFPPGTAKTRPEIYIMGTREPYTLAIDPETQWMVWADVGPDGFGVTEEYNLAANPYNAGFPYFAGKNKLLTLGDGIHPTPGDKNPAAPTNTNPANTGLANLPPAIPATFAYEQSCGMTGPIYRYDPIPNSPVKMPPQFDGLWFVTDFLKNSIDTMRLDATGAVRGYGKAFSLKLNHPTDFKVGPDGAFYLMNYAGNYNSVTATAIVRIDYTGTCRPDVTPPTSRRTIRLLRPESLRIEGLRVRVHPDAEAVLRVWDVNGRVWLEETMSGPREYDLGRLLGRRPGLYGLTLSSDQGSLVRKMLVAPN
ncbi:MAG: secreted glycosyl hydrolase [Fibrobacteres bacterium]|nr:secreted glycosyl hydrolase [Fibrobacterota bacterium]